MEGYRASGFVLADPRPRNGPIDQRKEAILQEIKFSDIQRASASSSREEVYLEASTVASRVVGWNDSGQIVVRCESEEWAIASGAAYIRRNNDYGQVYRVTKEKQLRQVKKVVWI